MAAAAELPGCFSEECIPEQIEAVVSPLSIIKLKHHFCVACAMTTTAVTPIQLEGLEGRAVVFHRRSSLQAGL